MSDEIPWQIEYDLQYEDDLPRDITQSEYRAWFGNSVIVDGVRMGPRFERNTVTGELSLDQRVAMLENEVREINRIISRNLEGILPPAHERLPFSWPVGDITRRTLAPWWLGMGYAEKYPPIMGRSDWHTGVDLNEAHDVDAPVYAVADGLIRFAGEIKGWEGEVVVIEHTLEDKRLIWSRYAHIDMLIIDQWTVYSGQQVKRGELIGHIADYTPYGPKQDHLHFDLSWHDLGKSPGDWPNTDIARLRVDYVDPIAWILERLP